MPRKTFLQRLDDTVRWTGIPAIAAQQQRRRRLLVPPVVALLLATGGLIYCLAHPSGYWPGYACLMFGFAISNFMPLLGPVIPWGSTHRVDERERALRRSAYLVGLASIGVASFLGLWLLVALASLGGLSVEQLVRDMAALAFYLMTLHGSVPTLWASWRTPPLAEE